METNFKKYLNKYQEECNSFFENIKSFKDINIDMIYKIIDCIGYEGFNDMDDAIEYLTYKIEEYKKFSNPVILYRVIAVKDKSVINISDLGQHYVKDEWMLDGDFLLKIGSELWDYDVKPYIIKVSVPLSEINIKQTLVQNLSFPREDEINLVDNPQELKILDIYDFYYRS